VLSLLPVTAMTNGHKTVHLMYLVLLFVVTALIIEYVAVYTISTSSFVYRGYVTNLVTSIVVVDCRHRLLSSIVVVMVVLIARPYCCLSSQL
jgi:hypothetical protein